jgi:integrase
MRGVYKLRKTRNIFKGPNGRWYFDFSCDGKRYIRLGGVTKQEAKDAMARLWVDLLNGPKDEPVNVEDPPFIDFAKEYIELHAKPNKRSWQRDEYSIKRLADFFGRRRLSEVNLLSIEKYRVRRLKEVSISTVHRELACLKGILSKAVDWEKLPSFPLKKIKIDLRLEPRRERVLSEEEEARLLPAASPYLRSMIRLVLNTGMREGEVKTLRAEHVDLVSRFITITKENSKSKKSRRIPMNSVVVELLRNLAPKDGGFVFRKPNGEPYKDIIGGFRAACRRARKDPEDKKDAGIEDLKFHDLRHTFETRGLDRGMNIANMRDIQGHNSVDFSLSRYYHESREKLLDDIEKIVEKAVNTKEDTKGEPPAESLSHLKYSN